MLGAKKFKFYLHHQIIAECRYTERKISAVELIDALKTSSAKGAGESSETLSGCGRPEGTNRSNSFSETCASVAPNSSASGSPLVNFNIIVEEKLQFNSKRRYETQVSADFYFENLFEIEIELLFFRF